MPSVRSRLCAVVVYNMLYAIGVTRAAIHIGLTDNEQYTPFGCETIPEFPSGIILILFLILSTILIIINLLTKNPFFQLRQPLRILKLNTNIIQD